MEYVKQLTERIGTDTLRFLFPNMIAAGLGSPFGRAVTAGD